MSLAVSNINVKSEIKQPPVTLRYQTKFEMKNNFSNNLGRLAFLSFSTAHTFEKTFMWLEQYAMIKLQTHDSMVQDLEPHYYLVDLTTFRKPRTNLQVYLYGQITGTSAEFTIPIITTPTGSRLDVSKATKEQWDAMPPFQEHPNSVPSPTKSLLTIVCDKTEEKKK
jgi:hypothetical protein